MGGCVAKSPRGGEEEEVLHIISVVFNPAGFATRTELFKKYVEEVRKLKGAVVWTVECVFEGQDFEVTKKGEKHHVQVKAPQKLWLKENLINIAAKRFLPPSWKYMAWVDGDILFEDKNVVEHTISALQVHPVVQMFETVKFLGPNDETLEENHSFGYYRTELASIDPSQFDKAYPHPGFAWAIRRDAFEAINGLPDFSIVGNCDNHLAYGLIKRITESIPVQAAAHVSPGYTTSLTSLEDTLVKMQARYHSHTGLGPGYVKNSTIRHMWHGDWKDRGYVTRWSCLDVDGVLFDPSVHLAYNADGVVTVTDGRFLKKVEEYFVSRKEDSKEVVTDHKNKHKKSGGGGGGGASKSDKSGSKSGGKKKSTDRRRKKRADGGEDDDSSLSEFHSAEEDCAEHEAVHGDDGRDCGEGDHGHHEDGGAHDHGGSGGGGGDAGGHCDGDGGHHGGSGGGGHCGGDGGGGDIFSAAHNAYN